MAGVYGSTGRDLSEGAGRERDDADPDRGRERDVDEHEPPGQVLAPLDVPDGHLHEQEPENAGGEHEVAPGASARRHEERGDDAEERDAEDRRVARRGCAARPARVPVALDLLPAGMRPRRSRRTSR